jgi:ribosomal 30S subunit maturation factor RimM
VWLQNPSGWRATKILSSSPRGDHFCLELACSSDRTTAEGLIGTRICISRPQESEDLYWSDLIGKPVENTSGILLGTVSRLETNGEHDWLVVGPHFIPLVNRHVLSLGKKGSPIVVDWNEDWSQ